MIVPGHVLANIWDGMRKDDGFSMGEILYRIVEWIARCHNYLLKLNDAYEYNFSDKQLHFLVIGCIGMLVLLITYPIFRLLAKQKMYLTISGIYSFTVIIVLTFAIEIGQRLSHTGTMEFADIMYGVMGFLTIFGAAAIAKGVYLLLKYIIIKIKNSQNTKNINNTQDTDNININNTQNTDSINTNLRDI